MNDKTKYFFIFIAFIQYLGDRIDIYLDYHNLLKLRELSFIFQFKS